MDSSKVFGEVIEYLEKIVLESGEIDYEEISRIALSPASLFQRIFIYISGVSISEYVRKRRLTSAGRDLMNGGVSVLDAAMKYGFASHSAFTRAFKEHHGITPSEAKQGTAVLNNYLPINFTEMRFIGGKRIMAEMKKIIYKEAEERLMAGMHRETCFRDGGGVWREFFGNGTAEKLNALKGEKSCGDIEANDGIGLMYNFKGKDNFDVIIGDFLKSSAEVPNGIFVKRIPKCLNAHVQIEGNNIDDILASAYLLITEAIEKTGREIDFDNFYWGEIYTHERYCEPMKRGERVTIDYIMPVKA